MTLKELDEQYPDPAEKEWFMHYMYQVDDDLFNGPRKEDLEIDHSYYWNHRFSFSFFLIVFISLLDLSLSYLLLISPAVMAPPGTRTTT